MTARLRILLVSPLPPPTGGIARWTVIVTNHFANSTEVETPVINTALRLRSPQSRSKTLRIVAGSIEAAWTIIRFTWAVATTAPDVVHVNTAGQLGLFRDVLLLRIGRLFGVPGVAHLRFGRVPSLAAHPTWEWTWLSRLFKEAHTVVAIDSETASTVSELFPNVRMKHIPNCVSMEPQTSGSTERRISKMVLFVGWLVPSKGIEELLQAWSAVRQPGWRLRLVGPYSSSYREELNDKRLITEGVEIIGEMGHSAVISELRACSVFVLPSHTEGSPNVVLEAMAAGAPIIASTVGGIPQMLKDGCGIMIPPGDLDELISSLSLLMSDAQAAEAMGKLPARGLKRSMP